MKILKKRLEVYSTARQIRNAERCDNSLLADRISMGDFLQYFSKQNKPRASDAVRTFCMHKASMHARSTLKLGEDFLNFLQDKEYLFSFFEELASQKVSINELRASDKDSFFDEYLEALEGVLRLYLQELSELGFCDSISETQLLANEHLLDQYEDIKVYLDGYLKAHEIEFLSSLKNLKIYLETSEYNIELLKQSFGLDFKSDYQYTLEYNDGWQIVSAQANVASFCVQYAGLKNAQMQFIYALSAIADDVNSGIDPEDILLILCNENQANILRAVDVFNYTNIAKGFKDIGFSQKLDALLAQVKMPMQKEAILRSVCELNTSAKVDNELLISLTSDAKSAQELAQNLANIDELSQLMPLSLADKLQLIKTPNSPHIAGGLVSVIGALEMRGLQAKSVIVCGFNDDCVPARASASMYLNAGLRARAGLISDEQRENLQRHYYYCLFKKAQKVRILFEENEEKKPARFLKKFAKKERIKINEDDLFFSYANSFAPSKQTTIDESVYLDWPEQAAGHDFKSSKISYTKLSSLERSGAEYYYKYVLNIKEPRALIADAASAGVAIHKLLETAPLGSLDAFMQHFAESLSELDELSKLIYVQNLQTCYYLISQEEGLNELEIQADFQGLNLFGFIDRFALSGVLIDYKNSANYTNTSHASQLAFYALMMANLSEAKLDDKAINLPAVAELQAFNVYLKSTAACIISRSVGEKECAKISEKLLKAADDIRNFSFAPKAAYGYFYLLANKERSKL